MIFICLPTGTINELPLFDYTVDQLTNVTSIKANGINSTTPGPFTSIPPNICLLPNLQVCLNMSFSSAYAIECLLGN